jgi:hypothetical protein
MAQLSLIEKAFIEEPLLSFETTPFLKRAWDPIASIPVLPALEDDPIEEGYIVSLLEGALEILKIFKIPCILPKPDTVIEGMEVGDDRIDISICAFVLALAIYCQSRVLRFETSWKDTGISRHVWNFCEVTSVVPSTTMGNIQRAKKKGFDELEFVDSAPLRVVIDVQKGDRSHSSSATGKAQMLGARTRSARTSTSANLHIANWLQDTMLNTCRSPDPKYLPSVMGGSGCPSLWGAWQNTYLYIKAYKNGTYERIYASAISELRECVNSLEKGERTQPVLCSHLRMKQDYLHITYASNVLVPQTGIKVGLDLSEVEPLYRALGGTALCQGVENRLIQAGKILTQSKASAEIDITDGILQTLFAAQKVTTTRLERQSISRRARAEFDEALRANSAIQRLLSRNATHHDLLEVTGGDFLSATSGVQVLGPYLAEWIHLGGKGETFTIEDLIFSEDMYLTEEVSISRSLRVADIALTPLLNNQQVVQKLTVSKVGLWQMSETKLRWSEKITEQLIELRHKVKNPGFQHVFPIYYNNREWVNDDSLLVREATEISKSKTKVSIILVSADARLGRRMARTSGLPVARVSPLEVVLNNPDKDYNSSVCFTAQEVLGTTKPGKDLLVGYPPVSDEILIDTGSLEAYAQKFVRREREQGGAELLHVTLQRTGFRDESGTRYEILKKQRIPGIRVIKIYMHLANGQDRTTVSKRLEDQSAPAALLQRAQAGWRRFPKLF